MAEMIPFKYIDFYDVPRCIVLRYRERMILLQSAFDEKLDDYPPVYSVYLLPESAEGLLRNNSWEFLNTSLTRMGEIRIDEVVFDPSKRKELDASILANLIVDEGGETKYINEPRHN
jgi:hypothetical protein